MEALMGSFHSSLSPSLCLFHCLLHGLAVHFTSLTGFFCIPGRQCKEVRSFSYKGFILLPWKESRFPDSICPVEPGLVSDTAAASFRGYGPSLGVKAVINTDSQSQLPR